MKLLLLQHGRQYAPTLALSLHYCSNIGFNIVLCEHLLHLDVNARAHNKRKLIRQKHTCTDPLKLQPTQLQHWCSLLHTTLITRLLLKQTLPYVHACSISIMNNLQRHCDLQSCTTLPVPMIILVYAIRTHLGSSHLSKHAKAIRARDTNKEVLTLKHLPQWHVRRAP
jgi:hypothetical protein